MSKPPVIVWFRQDLRLADNPALDAAIESGAPIIPLYIWSPDEEGPWAPGGASTWWLHRSLISLSDSLMTLGSNLVVLRGNAAEVLQKLAMESGARTICLNRRYEPQIIERDGEVKTSLKTLGLEAENFSGTLLFEPWSIQNGSGKPFQVFTAFYNACMKLPPPAGPSAAPKRLLAPSRWPDSLRIEDLKLESTIPWADGLREMWQPGETGAAKMLRSFVDKPMNHYAEERDRPDHAATSRLSPHLHFGEISPRQIWHAAKDQPHAQPYLRQIIWREFAHHLLFHSPDAPQQPLRAEFRNFPWQTNSKELHATLTAWTRGQTGYPLVDAGMRELWHTGWMHNRVRMVAASFLVKHLLIPWQEGAAWFWDTLVDADLANNTLGWQWVAGCGADAAPYFRIFNPTLQSEKFDPKGLYIRRWVPELSALPNKWIHKPSQAPAQVLRDAGVTLGIRYPVPIVNHEEARARALEAFAKLRSK
jgi:deoxyribodipyrimidine photo-lyase